MHKQSKQDAEPVDAYTERLVVIQVVGVKRGRERARMYRALRDVAQESIDAAIESLQSAGVVVVKGKSVCESPALGRIDRLHLIGI